MTKNIIITLIIIFTILAGCSNKVEHTNVPLIKRELTQKQLFHSEPRSTPITHVVIHFISNAANKPQEPYNVRDIQKIFSDYGVSSHYIIGRNGEIYHVVPENRVAFHAGKGEITSFPHYKDKLNLYSIGIELMAIGTKEEMRSMISDTVYHSINPNHIGFTDAQYQSLSQLLDDIMARNSAIKRDRKHIVGHNEYAPDRKNDPGVLFDWSRIGF